MNTPLKSESAVNCGKCDGLFRLPRGISGKAKLVCPHCETELNVSDLLEMLPVAKVSSDSGNSDDPGDEPEVAKETVKESARPSKYAIDEQSYTIPKPFKTALRKRHHGHQTRHKTTKRAPFARQKFGMGDILKMLLGGLLAIPIAQLLLWWVFAVDPFRMVDRVHPYFPAIVPPALTPADVRPAIDQPDNRSRDMPPGHILNDTGIPPRLK